MDDENGLIWMDRFFEVNTGRDGLEPQEAQTKYSARRYGKRGKTNKTLAPGHESMR